MTDPRLPSDVRFLMAREAERSLRAAVGYLTLADENLSDRDDPLAKDACRKALVKATSALSRTTDLYKREQLRVAQQVEMEVGP